MPKFLETATYWTQGPLDRYGEPSWEGPYTTKVRWEQISEMFVTTDGQTDSSRARIYMDAKLEVGDYIYRGKSSESEPPNDAFVVRQFQEVRNVQGTKRERKVIL